MIRAILNLPPDVELLNAMLEGLVRVNMVLLRRQRFPPLYRAGVRYRWQHPGSHWWTVPQVLAAGWGDCKDFAAWRAAELRLAGERASAIVYQTGHNSFHAITSTPYGVEDPSRTLGMPESGG